MLPDKAKCVECSIISLSLSFWIKHLVIVSYKNLLLNSRFYIGHHLEVRLSLVVVVVVVVDLGLTAL